MIPGDAEKVEISIQSASQYRFSLRRTACGEAPLVRVMLIIAAYTHEILFSCHPVWAITPPSTLVRRRKRGRASG